MASSARAALLIEVFKLEDFVNADELDIATDEFEAASWLPIAADTWSTDEWDRHRAEWNAALSRMMSLIRKGDGEDH